MPLIRVSEIKRNEGTVDRWDRETRIYFSDPRKKSEISNFYFSFFHGLGLLFVFVYVVLFKIGFILAGT